MQALLSSLAEEAVAFRRQSRHINVLSVIEPAKSLTSQAGQRGKVMRNMSFSLTTEAAKKGTDYKDVTRRVGWAFLKPGEHFGMVEKGMGLKKGEKVKKFGEGECVSNTSERVDAIISMPFRAIKKETARESFGHLSEVEFVYMFCKHMGVNPSTIIHRIEYIKVK